MSDISLWEIAMLMKSERLVIDSTYFEQAREGWEGRTPAGRPVRRARMNGCGGRDPRPARPWTGSVTSRSRDTPKRNDAPPRIHQATVATHGSWLKLFEFLLKTKTLLYITLE